MEWGGGWGHRTQGARAPTCALGACGSLILKSLKFELLGEGEKQDLSCAYNGGRRDIHEHFSQPLRPPVIHPSSRRPGTWDEQRTWAAAVAGPALGAGGGAVGKPSAWTPVTFRQAQLCSPSGLGFALGRQFARLPSAQWLALGNAKDTEMRPA